MIQKFYYMHSVNGVFDGDKVQLLEKPEHQKPCKVIVTFIEDESDIESIRRYAGDDDAFNFWKMEEEDLYQDYLKKK